MKWVGWLVKLCIGALVMTLISLYATLTAVQMMANQVLAHYQLGEGVQKIEFSDFLAEFGKSLNIMKQPGGSQAEANKDAKPDGNVNGSGNGSTSAGNGSGQTTGTGNSGIADGTASAGNGGTAAGTDGAVGASGGTGEPDALPVFGQGSSGQSTEEKQQTVMSRDALQNTKDNMSADDKMKLFTMVYTKVPPEELQNISRLMEDGITQEELSQMEAIVKKYLTKEEFDQLTQILDKYG